MLNSKLGRLLIVDDEIETLTPLCDLLSEWGYEVAGYTSPKDALKELKEKDFDLLLTDLVMPEMDGIELIQAATKMDPHLVCIIITGKGTIQTAVEAMKTGAFDYLLKPIEWKMLRPVLSRAIEVRRLRKAEERYRSIVEDQTELVCRFLTDGPLTFVNEAYCRYFGKKSDELVGSSFMSLIPEDDHAKVKEQIFSLSIESPVETHENRVIKANGEICWQQWTNRALLDDMGNIVEFQAVGRDITERKQIEEVLRESEERYRTIIEQSADSIYLADIETRRLIEANQSFQRLLGYTYHEIPALTIYDFIMHERDDINGKIDHLIKGKPYFFGERRYRRKDGALLDVEVSASIISYRGRNVICGIIRNITERKQAEKARRKYLERLKILSYRLLEVQEAERRYIAKELHDEIGQTLTSLKLSIDMLSRLPTENITDSLSDLQAEVGKLLSQVRNMSLDLRPSMLDDLGLLPALLWHFERYTSQTNIRVLFKHSGLDKRFIPEVETVAYRIVQEALTNVARHAGINEATVVGTTKQDKLIIQVEDKGAGFDFGAVISAGRAAGLHGMEERLTLLGGKLTIKSSHGAGTRLTAEIPIEDSVQMKDQHDNNRTRR
jgi:PAS domain S-box-containing protein